MNKVDLMLLQNYSIATTYTIPKWVIFSNIAKTLAEILLLWNYFSIFVFGKHSG